VLDSKAMIAAVIGTPIALTRQTGYACPMSQ
jgi:hypothetical protein